MTLVLLGLTVAIALARTSIVRFLRAPAQPYIARVAGGLVALAGAYVAYYGWFELRTNRAGPGEAPSSAIVDRVTGWSSEVTVWIESVGSVRIAVAVVVLLAAVAVAVRVGRARGAGTGDGAADGQGASRSTRQPVPTDGSRT